MSKLIKLGSRGQAVAQLQRLLIDKGHLNPPDDGAFGPGTHRALVAFQTKAGLLRRRSR